MAFKNQRVVLSGCMTSSIGVKFSSGVKKQQKPSNELNSVQFNCQIQLSSDLASKKYHTRGISGDLQYQHWPDKTNKGIHKQHTSEKPEPTLTLFYFCVNACVSDVKTPSGG